MDGQRGRGVRIGVHKFGAGLVILQKFAQRVRVLLGKFAPYHHNARHQRGIGRDAIPFLRQIQRYAQVFHLHLRGGHIGLRQHRHGPAVGKLHRGQHLGGLAHKFHRHVLAGG